jgi:hypothetical protein
MAAGVVALTRTAPDDLTPDTQDSQEPG